ncbi:hypothetical protein VKT23_015301 [Stygiomarasmius scandens]|uniref:DUF6593 domain-containing protein n=1 Tax=Marasmiellus scandens TaxID=2682957 RepID=A0ABR1J2H9_9AGAR
MNPVIPLSYVTTVRQGGTENGAFVGEFEMGFLGRTHSSLYEWVTFDRRNHVELSRVLQAVKKTSDGKKTFKFENPWKKALKWTYHDQTFYWFYESSFALRRVCYATAEMPQDKAKVYARFTPRTKRTNGIITMETLEVTPEGHDFLDQIFVSLLILERQRLTPDVRIAQS